MKKCFPLVKHSRAGTGIRVWNNIRKRTSIADQSGQAQQIADINTVEKLLKSKGYLILSKSEHVIAGLLPIDYEVDDTRICIEVSIDFINLDDPVCVRFLGRQVPLDKVFKKLDFNIYNVVEISEFFEELKKVIPCCGYVPVKPKEAEYSWKNVGDSSEIVTHRKRSRTCKLLICPSDKSPTCQTCRYTQYLSSKAVNEGGGSLKNTAKGKPIRNVIPEITLCEDDNKNLIDVIRYILQDESAGLTEDQKLFMESQIKTGTTKHSKQHKWQKRLVTFHLFILQ